jgi:ApaG protein
MTSSKYLIQVETSAEFIEEQSSEDEGRYVFAYRIRIENQGLIPAKLISRHWMITDAEGRLQEVRGVGVIGEQPTIAAGQSFEYTSGCSIATPVGTMRGAYQMVAEDGTEFNAEIPEFLLAGPRVLH